MLKWFNWLSVFFCLLHYSAQWRYKGNVPLKMPRKGSKSLNFVLVKYKRYSGVAKVLGHMPLYEAKLPNYRQSGRGTK